MDSPSDFLETCLRRNGRKVNLYVLILKRRFMAEMFSALSAVFLFGWTSFAVYLVLGVKKANFNGNGNEYYVCVSGRYHFFAHVLHKTTT